MSDEQQPKQLNWLARLFRKKVRLTYWLGKDAYVCEICDFTERSPECIVFKDYYTKNSTVIRYHDKINYVLEQIK
jgi:hypothetical protein